jgi:NADPH:quinone reductase-like Zn-dependent oxidoreductase
LPRAQYSSPIFSGSRFDSTWTALFERAKPQPEEAAVVNGATGSAGRLPVQLARFLGTGKVIATGRNEGELRQTGH